MGIPRTIEGVLEATPESHPSTIQEVLGLDQEARRIAEGFSLALGGNPQSLHSVKQTARNTTGPT